MQVVEQEEHGMVVMELGVVQEVVVIVPVLPVVYKVLVQPILVVVEVLMVLL